MGKYEVYKKYGKLKEENARLRELNSDVIKRLNSILDSVEFEPPIEDDMVDIMLMLERGEGKDE